MSNDDLDEIRSGDPTCAGDTPAGKHLQQIGPYRILQTIGEGGMGIVYEAEQVAPLVRRVALKLIKVGMDTRDVIARFESERQALALMNHPNIASVYDAGTTPEGRPYFAMEYVQGIPITDYCDRHRLTIPERLNLFVGVCEGVQHAHQKGIIHRDIKPSNVLVTTQGETRIPKINRMRVHLGMASAILKRPAEAETMLLESIPKLPPRGAVTIRAIRFLVRFYDDWNRSQPNPERIARAADWKRRLEASQGSAAVH